MTSMKITDILNRKKPSFSLEVFPPKTDSKFETVQKAVDEIAALKPDFMSVTYGAGGGTSKYTTDIASSIQNNYGVTALSHLTCVSSDRERILVEIEKFKNAGIKNILALRGDIPDGMDTSELKYHYASELISEIKAYGDFCIGGACYPEGHPESPSVAADIDNLKRKVDAGCDFMTTQMFFDNNIFYKFLYKVRDRGINIPIIAGIMPVTAATQLTRIVKLSGNMVPPVFKAIADRFGDNNDAMTQAGIAFATEQIIDLFANGVNAVHVYTMNKPEVARSIQKNLSYIL